MSAGGSRSKKMTFSAEMFVKNFSFSFYLHVYKYVLKLVHNI